ncbi:MAG: hypothetical protein KIT14_00690 [bacterium]|nr:hypothetical protein [bacterium]
MQESHLRLDPPVRTAPAPGADPGVRWRGAFVPADGGDEAPIGFAFTYPDGAPLPASPRPFLLAALVPAMRVGAPLRIPRPVDATTLANLMEWQEAFACWRPHLRPVPLRAEVDPTPVPSPHLGGALAAFSGGADSCFTVVRHTTAPPEATYRRTALVAGVLVHGFEIALERAGEFAGAWQSARTCLDAFGLRAFRLRTDVRALEARFGCDWETETHGIAVAAALACYEPLATHLVVPSTYGYPRAVTPWGSNPTTDPLLGSAAVPLWHDGSAFTRVEKVLAIASHEVVRRTLRVCWEGGRLDRNCGHCFKCIVTQAAFWLAGFADVPAFPDRCTLDEVAALPTTLASRADIVRDLHATALARAHADLAHALGRALAPPPAPRRRWFAR